MTERTIRSYFFANEDSTDVASCIRSISSTFGLTSVEIERAEARREGIIRFDLVPVEKADRVDLVQAGERRWREEESNIEPSGIYEVPGRFKRLDKDKKIPALGTKLLPDGSQRSQKLAS